MNFSQLTDIDYQLLQVLAIDLGLAILLLIIFRWLSGRFAGVSSTEELAHRDNHAFGVSMAGGIAALAILLSGVVSGESLNDLQTEVIVVGGYGLLGIFLIKIGRMIQDFLVLPAVEIRTQISHGNMALAIVDVAHVIATALMLRAAIIWAGGDSWIGLSAVLAAFAISQLMLGGISRMRRAIYANRNTGKQLDSGLESGNLALALRYAGHIIGVAFAVNSAAWFVVFDPVNWFASLAIWTVATAVLMLLLSFLAFIVRSLVLAGIDVRQEVDEQENIGVGAIEAVLYLSIALLLNSVIV
ncbi:DUF350 domain-containing protein [Pelagibaculum spongiae]|uniref:DUF350 domain-containing protein n=1 Tax=Pelagibaculum spongiae TaxID=2080658 RepID=A0A2V1GVD2_9GAMM|nr:DUF350 domain-containing protein [Pelagibaculum spongiae]PVZ63863.1 hypothetical protein DC094_20255 [Pelagibaculum spongiae]